MTVNKTEICKFRILWLTIQKRSALCRKIYFISRDLLRCEADCIVTGDKVDLRQKAFLFSNKVYPIIPHIYIHTYTRAFSDIHTHTHTHTHTNARTHTYKWTSTLLYFYLFAITTWILFFQILYFTVLSYNDTLCIWNKSSVLNSKIRRKKMLLSNLYKWAWHAIELFRMNNLFCIMDVYRYKSEKWK